MIWVFGDSFSTGSGAHSWTTLIGANRVVSSNGISEYRILCAVERERGAIQPGDTVIVCHTNPLRIFLPDHVAYPARAKASHPHCDLVMGDALSRSWLWRFVAWVYGTYFFDESYLLHQHAMMVAEIDRLITSRGARCIHISGFEARPPIASFHDLFLAHRGTLNHMDEAGNAALAARLT